MKRARKKKNRKSSNPHVCYSTRGSYKINGRHKEEPPGGWVAPTANTQLGRHLIDLYHNGLDVNIAPTAIYHQHPILQGVKYGSNYFGAFKNRCVEQFQKECKKRQQERKVTFRDGQPSIIASSSSSSEESAMSSSSSDSDDESSSLPSAVWPKNKTKPDAPDRKAIAPVPLVVGQALNVRNKQVHVPFYCTELTFGYLTFIQLLVGASEYTAKRDRKNSYQLIFRWKSGLLGSEEGVDQMFAHASRTDNTLIAVRNTVAEHNGARASADEGSHPTDFMIINLGKKVKNRTIPWGLTSKDGHQLQIDGITFVKEYLVCYWEKLSADAGLVNRVGSSGGFTPQRATFNPGDGYNNTPPPAYVQNIADAAYRYQVHQGQQQAYQQYQPYQPTAHQAYQQQPYTTYYQQPQAHPQTPPRNVHFQAPPPQQHFQPQAQQPNRPPPEQAQQQQPHQPPPQQFQPQAQQQPHPDPPQQFQPQAQQPHQPPPFVPNDPPTMASVMSGFTGVTISTDGSNSSRVDANYNADSESWTL